LVNHPSNRGSSSTTAHTPQSRWRRTTAWSVDAIAASSTSEINLSSRESDLIKK